MAALTIAEAAAAADLPEAAQPGRPGEDFGGGWAVVAVEFIFGERAGADEGHFAADDMPQLRQLVQRMTTAKGGKGTGDAGIAIGFLDVAVRDLGRQEFEEDGPTAAIRFGGAFPHRAQFQNPKRAATLRDTPMCNERRTAREESHGRRRDEQNRRARNKQ